MTAPDAPLLETAADGIVTLTLNRPAVRNALNLPMLEELEAALLRLRLDDSGTTRVVILRGAGEGFMAGGDIKHFEGVLREGNPAHTFSRMLDRINFIVQLMRDLPQPMIAAVHGACAGFGVSLALSCDLVIAADTAKFTMAYDRLGLSPDGGASWHLVHTLGLKRAAELALLGDTIAANTAERWGMINRVVPEAELENAVSQTAQRLKVGAPQAQARVKHLLNFAGELRLSAQLDSEAENFAHLTTTSDFAEGVAAFLAKRPPGFKGN